MTLDKPLLRVLRGERPPVPPIWLMRQAGRYLPEYRAVREKAGSFLDLCFNPDLAVEVTLQPVRRFGLDAAILFSDILVVPHALGQRLWFEEGAGPKLAALATPDQLADTSWHDFDAALAPVFETVRGVASALPPATTLIGFAGAPWTLASYMVEGGSSRDFARVKTWAYGDPDGFQQLIDLLVAATSRYLIAQAEAGAEVVQIFDSWAGVLAEEPLRRWSLAPLREIVRRVKAARPSLPVILFPRGAGVLYGDFADEGGAEALSLDSGVPLAWVRERLQTRVVVQGNLDPMMLLCGGVELQREVHRILATLGPGGFIFNLGHGIVPQTPVENVAMLIDLVRGSEVVRD